EVVATRDPSLPDEISLRSAVASTFRWTHWSGWFQRYQPGVTAIVPFPHAPEDGWMLLFDLHLIYGIGLERSESSDDYW
ncbi:MAG: hypothetical protein KDA28_14105, partial [Phycisphaerales bacterium]|nr:hypothetical protein [Phycisphaerales bacterium]